MSEKQRANYSPWFPWTLASIYGACDEIICVNFGHDIHHPTKMGAIPKVTKEIHRLDVDHKVIQVTEVDPKRLRHAYPIGTQKEANERRRTTGEGYWYDIRGLNLTAANELAVERGADWILKIDTDEVCYADISKLRENLGSWLFYQWEFAGDIGGPSSYLSSPPPASPWNDTAQTYPASRQTWYIGAGAIVDDQIQRVPTNLFHCAHLRNANPVWLTERQKFEHFYGRVFWRLYTNDYGEFCTQLYEKATADARGMMTPGKISADVDPPEVCFYSDPFDYITGL